MLLAGAVTLSAWAVWFFGSRVSVYALSDAARIEVDTAVYSVAAQASGRVVSQHLELASRVEKGDVLVRLDSEANELELAEARARLEALEDELKPLVRQLEAQEKRRKYARAGAEAALSESKSKLEEAEVAANFAQARSERHQKLMQQGVTSEEVAQTYAASAETQSRSLDSLRHGLQRLELVRVGAEDELKAQTEGLWRDLARLRGEKSTLTARLERLEHEIAERRICAPVSGRLGDIADLRPGSFIEAGDRVAAVLPDGHLRVIAELDPAKAAGRVAPGQAATLRLDGLPWAEYGVLAVRVDRVAGEPREGMARVELSIADPAFRGHLVHGMTGTVDIEVERVSPAVLVLRAAGKFFDRKASESLVQKD
jgi:membrane fusion protein (multidrug efflux system)